MEIIKASGYDILATCGGKGLCATCHVQVVQVLNLLPLPNPNEMQTLDIL
ncbi:2Fe-2S iron-sulfur cluster-binding protein [Mucilaginibacter sp. PAMB04274]